jgi:hypothetical protein
MDTIADLAAEIALLKVEAATACNRIASLRDQNMTLKAEFELEQQRSDKLFALAAWAASRCGGGAFDHVARLMVGRGEELWAKRRRGADMAPTPFDIGHGHPDPAA